MNSSLLLVAVHFLPEISRAVAHSQESETARQVSRAVRAVAGTGNPFLALRRIEADLGRSAALRIRLASIACDREIALAEARTRNGQAGARHPFPGRAHALGLAMTLCAGFLSIFALGFRWSQAAPASPRLAGPVASSLLLAAMLLAAMGITTRSDEPEAVAVLAPAPEAADASALPSEPVPQAADLMRPA